MARKVFSKGATRKLSVSTENVARPTLVDRGDYLCSVKRAALIESHRGGNISVVLELLDPESNDHYDTRPLWVAGPNAGEGNMAGRNLGIVRDLLEAVGIPPDAYKEITDELLARLVNKTFDLRLDLDRGSRGGEFNVIVRVNQVIDPPDAVPVPNPAAD
jgi:hypothetical protein